MIESGGSLWITRMARDGNDRDVCTLDFDSSESVIRVFAHSSRIFRNAAQGADALEPGDLIVTLLHSNGDRADDDPLRVPADQADWYLHTFLKVDP